MGKIVKGQYDCTVYPLKRYTITEIPMYIWGILLGTQEKSSAVIRGGLAYILLSNDMNYILKDIDLLCKESEAERIVENFSVLADVVYINKNTFKESVITAFLSDHHGTYYKIDTLMVKEMPPLNTVEWNDYTLLVIGIVELWCDRVKKISQNKLRRHSREKTLNHINVLENITLAIRHRNELFSPCSREELEKVTNNAIEVMKDFVSPDKYIVFQENIKYILEKMKFFK